MLTKARKVVISGLAEFIANEYFPDNVILPERIAEENGITISCSDYGDCFDGLLEHSFGEFHIYLNRSRLKTCESPRARFTLGHELGHFYLDEHRNALKSGKTPCHGSFIDFSSKNPVEMEADCFSANLLLPPSRLKRDLINKKFEYTTIEEISEKYRTSFTATAIQFSEYGNQPIFIICSQNNVIKWYRYSDDFPFIYLLRKVGDKVPKATVAGEFFDKGIKRYEPETVFSGDWFNIYNKEEQAVELTEKCVYSDSAGIVISVIWG